MNFLDMLFQVILPLYFAAMIGLLILMALKSKGKLKALVLSPSMQYAVKKVATKGHFLKFNKHWKPEFAPQDVFIEKKPFYAFWRRPNLMVVIPENARKALKWEKEETGKNNPDSKKALVTKLKHLWTDEEIIQFAEKEAYMAELKSKPMSNMMFVMLAILIAANLFLTFFMANRMGLL
ncbi:MAG: hypothetical protein OEZ38_03405 [Gammaproteobacteria bacterium]|nr:hypothetical protein [Gammaproteobacteria bacterium]